MKKYQIIYADPPWAIGCGALSPNYPVMELGDIAALPVDSIVADNAALFIWALGTRLPDAIYVLQKWGFTFKAIAFVWVKVTKKSWTIDCRMGTWTLTGTELCLLGVRGRVNRVERNVRQVILAPRGYHGQHSTKPAQVRQDIVRLFGNLPRIELFARQKVEGWDCWGNEVESDVGLLGTGEIKAPDWF